MLVSVHFCLNGIVSSQAHILRRPIIVYAEEDFRNHRGDVMQKSDFQGTYLPILLVLLMFHSNFC